MNLQCHYSLLIRSFKSFVPQRQAPKVIPQHTGMLANWTNVWDSDQKKRIFRFWDIHSQWCEHREQEELFYFIAWRWLFFSPSLTLSFDSHSRWPQWHEWNRKEVPPHPRPHQPPLLCDWQRWQAALMIKLSWTSESVPGKLLSYASVMVCSPGYLHHLSMIVASVYGASLSAWLPGFCSFTCCCLPKPCKRKPNSLDIVLQLTIET